MIDKILTFIIGILIGAIITTSIFLIYNKTLEKNSNKLEMKGNGQMQSPPSENKGEPSTMPNQNGGTPPEMPQSSNNNNI